MLRVDATPAEVLPLSFRFYLWIQDKIPQKTPNRIKLSEHFVLFRRERNRRPIVRDIDLERFVFQYFSVYHRR